MRLRVSFHGVAWASCVLFGSMAADSLAGWGLEEALCLPPRCEVGRVPRHSVRRAGSLAALPAEEVPSESFFEEWACGLLRGLPGLSSVNTKLIWGLAAREVSGGAHLVMTCHLLSHCRDELPDS